MSNPSTRASPPFAPPLAPAAREPRAERLLSGAAGVEGNDRLTSAAGVLLLILLAVESATLLSLRSTIGLHVSLGLALIVPVAIKIATTLWRFARYYTHADAYVDRGPPELGLRLLGPPLVIVTVVLLATGVVLVVAGPPRGFVFTLHKLSFILWVGLIAVHVLAHLEHALRGAADDWGRGRRLHGVGIRRGALALTVLATLIVGVATVPANATWVHWMATHHHHERGG